MNIAVFGVKHITRRGKIALRAGLATALLAFARGVKPKDTIVPKDIIDIVDTAVKIGLGSLIAGIATYVVNAHNTNKEKKKYSLEHKIKMLEGALENLESYFNSWSLMYALASGIRRGLESKGGVFDKIPDNAFKQLRGLDKDLIESWNHRSSAVSQLILIGANEVVDLVEEYSELQKVERNKIIFDKVIPGKDSYEENVNLTKELRKNIRIKSAEFYSQLMA